MDTEFLSGSDIHLWRVTELADCLPIAPVWSWQVGEARRTPKGSPLAGVYCDSYCTFDLGGGEDGEVAKHILRDLEGLTPKREFIRNVSTTGGSAALYVFWYPNGDTGEVFEAPLLSALGEAGIALMLNVYDDRETLGRRLSQAAKPTTLHSLIQAITAPHDVPGDSDASKFSVTGCDMEINTSVISSLALLLNEFVTNATKYGALSTDAGRIRIQCAYQGETLFVTWTERGGPEIVAPTNKGFGDLLVRTTIAGLGGEISREWHPEGLNIRLSIPRERLTP